MTNFFDKILSYKKDDIKTVWHILGFKFSFKNNEATLKSIKIQDSYDLSELKRAKELIVFFVPKFEMITGGILSIYSICKYSREICPDALCLISTPPGKYTYSHNNYFKNEEKIYRMEQITNNALKAQKVILHIPECMAANFYKELNKKEIKFLKSIKNLQINILNQNIELMPEASKLKTLEALTENITQTIAHKRYATHKICDKWQMPAHFLSVYVNLPEHKHYNFDEKEKIIVLSPDIIDYKQTIIDKLKNNLPNFKLITVQNLSFDRYLDLISKAYFSISFGEGFDGYFNQPAYAGSVGFSVYNDTFFPDKNWSKLENVFSSYNEMSKNIVEKCKNLLENKIEYEKIVQTHRESLKKLESVELLKKRLNEFYSKNYKLCSGEEN